MVQAGRVGSRCDFRVLANCDVVGSRLLLFQDDAFVLVASDRAADLCRGLPQLSLLVGEKALLGASRALGAVQPLEATA